MSTNETQKSASTIILPSNPADRKKIMEQMREISGFYTLIESQKDLVKESIDALSKEFNLPKRALNKLSRVLHKGNFDEEAGKFEEFADLYDTLTNGDRAAPAQDTQVDDLVPDSDSEEFDV